MSKEIKQPKIISIMHRKGGVGKSTTTLTLASYLNHKGYNVMILDVDENNASCILERKLDLETIQQLGPNTKNKKLYDHYQAQGKIYEINLVKQEEIHNVILTIKENNDNLKLDYIFIDSPGEVKNKAFTKTISVVEHILVPFKNDVKNMTNTIEYFMILKTLRANFQNIKTLHLLFNDIEYSLDEALNIIMANNIVDSEIFDTVIKHNKQSRRGNFQSLFPIENETTEQLCKEFIKKIK